jgi:hypothetical protein
MKKLLTIALMGLSFSAFSYEEEPRYYAADFKIVSVRPMCPINIPGGAVCMGIGSIVTVETTLHGCLDNLVFSDFQERSIGAGVELYAVGVAKEDPRSKSVRCVRANKVSKTVTVNGLGSIRLLNQTIEQ